MVKNELIKLLNEIFIPLGFKHKGNNWVCNNSEIWKIINLQKSNYSNSFYINYGFSVIGLKLITKIHIENRLGSLDQSEQLYITKLLDLDSAISHNDRLNALKEVIEKSICAKIESINTQLDLLNELKSYSHLNNIPLIVKEYFNLKD